MTGAAKRKGDNAERELAKILCDHLGVNVRRKLGAGRRDDTGDLEGLGNVCIEVKAYADIARAVREGLDDLEREQVNGASPFGVLFVRRPGGRWFAAMTVPQFAAWYREATS